MPLHFFIEGPARQLQFFKYRFHVALVPGQRRAQAMRFERFGLRRQRLAGIDAGRFRLALALAFSRASLAPTVFVLLDNIANDANPVGARLAREGGRSGTTRTSPESAHAAASFH